MNPQLMILNPSSESVERILTQLAINRSAMNDPAVYRDRVLLDHYRRQEAQLEQALELAQLKEHRENPDIGYHREMRRHYNKLASKDLGAGHGEGADYWLGAAAAENRSVAAEMRQGRFEKNPCNSKSKRSKRRKNPCATAKKHKMFHDAHPDRAYKVKVPKGFPRRMWMLGKLKGITTTGGRKLSGGYVAAGKGNTIYLLDVRRGGFDKDRVAVIEYDPVKPSKKAGPVYYHPYKTPPSIKRVAKGFYIIRGPKQKLTPRGIIG